MKSFRFSQTPLDPQALRIALEDPQAGGYASFEGWVRNHNEGLAVTRLDYEAFEALANKEGERIVAEALQRFAVVNAACVHRVGRLEIGELAVWVGVSSRHRAEAFDACRYIIDEVKHRAPIWKKEHYVSGDSGWVNCERCAEHAHAAHEHVATGNWPLATGTTVQTAVGTHHSGDHDHHSHGHSSASVLASDQWPAASRHCSDYSRQIALRDVGVEGQAKLSAARVLVIGAGGLGAPVLTYLAGAGIGTLGIVDGDTLDASNLHRQTLYALSDVGKPKAELAAQRLRSLNPDVVLHAHVEKITAANAKRLLADYHMVIECSDNFATKFLVNDAAVRAGKPAIFASVYQYEGQLQVYRPDLGNACLRCLWPEATRDGLVGNCAEAGVLGPVPGVLGTLQALEALKLLLNLPGQLTAHMVLLDLLTLEQRKLTTARRADCVHDGSRSLHVPAADIELSFGELPEAVSAGYTLIDVREPQEINAAPITPAPSIEIPLGTLLATVPALNPSYKYLLVCARGARSRAATEHLRERGFKQAFSLRGGMAGLESRVQIEER